MARIRTIKPEFWKHEDLSALPEITHMLAAALLNHADDEGHFNANPALVKAECLPLRESSVSTHDSLQQLAKAGFIELGIGADGKRYGRVVKFDEHQRVNRPTPSKIKAMHVVWEDSSTTHTQLSESSPPERNREQGREEEQHQDSPAGESSDFTLDGQEGGTVSHHPDNRVCQAVLAAYHETLPKCRAVAVVNPKLQRKILLAHKLAKKVCQQQGLVYDNAEFWGAYFAQCLDDPWLRGDVPNPKNPRWKQNLGVLISEDRFAEIMDNAIAKMHAEEAA